MGEHPDYRFSLANERTFLAWVRTALALLAGGIAVVQIVPDFTIPVARHILILIATGYTRWERRERAILLGGPLPPSPLPRPAVPGTGGLLAGALLIIRAHRRYQATSAAVRNAHPPPTGGWSPRSPPLPPFCASPASAPS